MRLFGRTRSLLNPVQQQICDRDIAIEITAVWVETKAFSAFFEASFILSEKVGERCEVEMKEVGARVCLCATLTATPGLHGVAVVLACESQLLPVTQSLT